MKQVKISFIKSLEAENINNLKFSEMEKLRSKKLEKLYYSTNANGISGGVLRDENGKLYSITARNSSLFYFF